MNLVGYILLGVVVLTLGVFLGFYLIQDYLIFRGTKLTDHHTYQFNFNFEERNFYLIDGTRLNAILFKAKDSRGVVYYHHGNSGNIQLWGERASVFLNCGYDVLMYDYRGYGKSSGHIKREVELHSDAIHIYKELLKEYSSNQIVIYGISLGTGISAKLAAKFDCKALILETPYYNFHDVIRFHYPFLPVSLISKYNLKTNVYLKKVVCPVYLIHGTDDEVVDFESSLKLKKKFSHINLTSIDGGKHSDLDEFESYNKLIIKILDQ